MAAASSAVRGIHKDAFSSILHHVWLDLLHYLHTKHGLCTSSHNSTWVCRSDVSLIRLSQKEEDQLLAQMNMWRCKSYQVISEHAEDPEC